MTHRRPLDLELQAAVGLAELGWPVIPLERGGKRPLLRQWKELGTATPEQARTWWTQDYPGANVGVLTGRLVVVDVDAKSGGLESYGSLDLPPTLSARTGGGGLHLYYANVTGEKVGNRTALVPGVDLRGTGGLVVAPPSVHASGRRYRWDQRVTTIAPFPDSLMELGVDDEEVRVYTASIIGGCGKEALESEVQTVKNWPEGGRNDQLNRSAYTLGAYIRMGELTRTEVSNALREAALGNRNGPPMTDHEVEATIRSGLRAGAA